jgi:hypothetical protein
MQDMDNMKTYNFKEMIEMALEQGSIFDIHEIIFCLDVDDLIVHEDDWKGEKPEQDVEFFGEHWFIL